MIMICGHVYRRESAHFPSKLTVLMVARLCRYNESYGILYFKCVNCMVYTLNLNKAVEKKKSKQEI